MAFNLPNKLNKEPLIDAVFEIRFSSIAPASIILPGSLFNSLEGEKVIESFPISQISKAVRDTDQNLKYAPLTRIDWKQFLISISDFSVAVSCKYPYPGWSQFKPAIITIMDILVGSKIVQEIERYSMKYIDIIPIQEARHIVAMLNLNMSIAGHTLTEEQFHIRIGIPKDNFIHTVQLASSAQAVLHNGLKKEGFIVDIDTVAAQNNISMQSLHEGISDKLEAIHLANKVMFFDCLTTQTINSLEPVYD